MDLQWRDAEPTAEERKVHEERGGKWLRQWGHQGLIEAVYYRPCSYDWRCIYSAMPAEPNPRAWAPVGHDFQAVEWPEVKPEWVRLAEDAIGRPFHEGEWFWQSEPVTVRNGDAVFWTVGTSGAESTFVHLRGPAHTELVEFCFPSGEPFKAELRRRVNAIYEALETK